MCRILVVSLIFFCSCLNKHLVEKQVSLFHETSQAITSYLDWRRVIFPELENSCALFYSFGEKRLFEVIDLQHQQIQSLLQSTIKVNIQNRKVESLVKK